MLTLLILTAAKVDTSTDASILAADAGPVKPWMHQPGKIAHVGVGPKGELEVSQLREDLEKLSSGESPQAAPVPEQPAQDLRLSMPSINVPTELSKPGDMAAKPSGAGPVLMSAVEGKASATAQLKVGMRAKLGARDAAGGLGIGQSVLQTTPDDYPYQCKCKKKTEEEEEEGVETSSALAELEQDMGVKMTGTCDHDPSIECMYLGDDAALLSVGLIALLA